MTHPRIAELPERWRHPRHFWIFDLPEMQTQIWLARFHQTEKAWQASPHRTQSHA
jgi:hypothetical protein